MNSMCAANMTSVSFLLAVANSQHTTSFRKGFAVQETLAFFQGTLERNFIYPNRVGDALTYMDTLNTEQCAAPLPAAVFPRYASLYEFVDPNVEEEEE